MYCINCGVKLAESESKCPLCNTSVCHPDFQQTEPKTLYPSNQMPKRKSGLKVLCVVISILYLLPLIVSFVSDLQTDGNLDWFGYVAGALAVSYVTLVLPLWFKKPNPVIFVPCSFASSALYLLYINLATNGDWYIAFALPIVGGFCVLISALIALLRYVKKARLYIFGGAFIALGGMILLIEHLLNVTFGVNFIGWSIYPFVVLTLLGGLLIYLAINSAARELIKRKLFF